MRTVAALAFLLALTVSYYWKLTVSSDYTWLENPDQVLQVRPWLDYESRELHAGRLPLWDPYLWGGQSLIGQVQPGVVNPLNWILFAMPLRDGHIPLSTLHWYWVLIHWLAAVFCYFLCRGLGVGYAPAVVGASIFTFAGFIGHSATPQFLMSALWTPLVFLFFVKVFRGERILRNAALCGAALAAAFLSGHHNVPIYCTVLLGGLWLWYLAVHRRVRRAWGAVAAFGAVWLLVSAVQLFPAIEYGKRAVRWSGVPEPQKWNDRLPYSVHEEYSLKARSIPGMVVPNLGLHANPFVGIVALALALTAIRTRWQSREVKIMSAVALGGLLLALGSDSPVQRLAYWIVPMVEKARYPAMAIVLCQVGIAGLAAMGLDAWRTGVKARAATVWGLAAFGGSILAIYGVLPLLHHPPATQVMLVIAGVALAMAAVLRWLRGAPAIVLALFLVESLTVPAAIQRRDVAGSYLKLIDDQSDIADFLKHQPGWFRVDIDEDVVPYNFGDWYGIDHFGGYVASMPINIHRILGHQPTPRLFGIRYRVAKQPSNPQQVEVFQSRSGLKVFRDPRFGEPLWAEHATPCGGTDEVRLVSRVSDSVVVDANLACGGLVVMGDPWYLGWRAWIDGRRVRIQEFEEIVRALPVDAGHHRIELRYRPGSVYWGAGLSTLGVLLVLFFCWNDRASSVSVRTQLTGVSLPRE